MNGFDLLDAAGGIRPEFIKEGLADRSMGKRKRSGPALRTAAALLILCFSFSGIGALAAPDYVKGIFRDIFGRGRAVIGTACEAGEEELEISAAWSEGKLVIYLRAADAGALPWKDLETISLVKYTVTDGSGRELFKEKDMTGQKAQDFREGEARIEVEADPVPEGPFTLTVEELEGGRKADAPLVIRGRWECLIGSAEKKTET